MNETFLSAVQTLGVQVVLCLLMAWFVKYMFDKFMAMLQTEKEDHKKEVDTLSEAINNNTIAMTKLVERLGGDDNITRD